MKTIITLILFHFLLPLYSQTIFKMAMKVQEVEFSNSYCTDDTTVYWGINKDTLCFAFMDKIRCYYPVSRAAFGNQKYELYKNFNRFKAYNKESVSWLLGDQFKELYLIKIITIHDQASIIIFIINLPHGVPNYTLTWNPSQPCNK